ncbi:hypothetical protein EW146_g4871 [Bondarzewia mesenterica]|uniref:Uncharacterized protein n=1 Tax=Bondarzewia mesenterica TaxID=1095465 RepID=A0A4V3XF01_9AGAM|nr:hypothetical protein EW146_g4871 [Bondarzewia mesenterica]
MGKAGSPEKIQESERLEYDANKWPFEEDQQNTTEETECPAQFVLARKEVKGFLRPDDEAETAEEKDLSDRRHKFDEM